jgi:hypothetical protein
MFANILLAFYHSEKRINDDIQAALGWMLALFYYTYILELERKLNTLREQMSRENSANNR